MPNEVDIRITATDLTGPAFASALAKMEALKKAAGGIDTHVMSDSIDEVSDKMDELRKDITNMSVIKMDTSDLNSSLTTIKSRIQSLGIADIADINIPQGRIISQLQFLKRMMVQAGIADIMDMNINSSSLSRKLSELSQMSENIPVQFDVGKLPQFSMTGFSVPVSFDVSKIPQFGNVSSLTAWDDAVKIANRDMEQLAISWEDAVKASGEFESPLRDTVNLVQDSDGVFSAATQSILDYAHSLGDGTQYNAFFGTSLKDVISAMADTGTALKDFAYNVVHDTYGVGFFADALRDLGGYVGGQGLMGIKLYANSIGTGLVSGLKTAGSVADSLTAKMINLGTLGIVATAYATKSFNDNISKGIPLWQRGGGWLGFLTGRVVTFGGALESLPFGTLYSHMFANIAGWHILADAIIETAATLIPAIVGMGAFAASAIDATDEIVSHFKNMNYVTDELGQNIYPLTGAFSAMNEAAKPQVYVLLGEGLQVVNKNAGVLATVAHQAGSVLDQLGARITYAITQGNGFNVFTRNAASDLLGWGNNIGNLFGIIGNVLKAMPGYAQIILNVFGEVSHTIENVTGSGFGQGLLKAGLAVHGFAIYVGLLGTGAAYVISKTLPALAAGARAVAEGFALIGADDAALAMANFAGAVAGAATLPWGWITIAAAGIGVLVYMLLNGKTAAQQFAAGVQSAITSVKISSLGSTITDDITNYSYALSQAEAQVKSFAAANKSISPNVFGTRGESQAAKNYADQVNQAKQDVANYSAVIVQAKSDQSLYNSNLAEAAGVFGTAGNALAAFNNAGISSSEFLTTSKQQFAEDIIEAKGYNDAIEALTGGTGRYAAAMNALSGPEQYLGDMLKSIQQITQAQDNLMTVVTSGETSLDTFALGLATMTTNFAGTSKAASTASHSLGDIKSATSLAGAAMGGTTQADYTMQQAFYSQVQSGQQVIDALEQQEASTKNLTTATATIADQMLPFAGNNTAARATIIAMINDALGPGTVSFQNLNKWVNNNTTSLSGLNGIIAQSTIKAGQLSNVLQTQLTAQFQADLLKSSGATQAMQNFTDALTHGGDQTAAYHSVRQQLIDDLEKTGLSAQDAKQYVNHLQGQINSLHGVTVGVGVHMSGSGGILETSTLPGMSQSTAHLVLGGLSKGGLLPGFGGGDQLLRLLEPGEAVIDKYRTRKFAGLLAMMGVPGMSAGGVVNDVGGYGATFAIDWGDLFAKTAANNFNAAIKKNSDSAPYGGPGGGSALANMRLAQALYPAYSSGPAWNAWNYVAMAESGWNQYADNPTSGAYGIAQALPFTKYPQAGWPSWAGGSSNPTAQITWMWDYMAQRWGGPINAASNEAQYHWYDNGGWLQPGMNHMYNGTGAPELLANVTGGTGNLQLSVSGGSTVFEKFMSEFIREFVRVKGGGDVQRAFGSRGKLWLTTLLSTLPQ